MRILWFTNTPSMAAARLSKGTSGGGWIASLEEEISKVKDIELGVAFPYGHEPPASFTINNTIYFTFPLLQDKGKVRGFLSRWKHTIEDENEVDYYLNVIEQFKPDVIHIFGSERSFGMICKTTEIPVVLQIQGNLTSCLAKWFSGIPHLNVFLNANKKSILLGYGIFHEYFLTRKRAERERELLKNCRNVIGRTDWDRRISRVLSPGSRYFRCDEMLRKPFYNQQWSFTDTSPIKIFSTLSPAIYKGLETVLYTASLLKKNGKIDFEWHIAGLRGNEDLVSITERHLNLRFRENNIVFKGLLTSEELASGLLSSNCFVHPSHIENSPNSVCEAMMLGVPVIATNSGGTSSMLLDGTEGILIQAGDPYLLAGAISELLSDTEKMKKYSKNGRERAQVRHNPENILNDVINIYSLLKVNRKK